MAKELGVQTHLEHRVQGEVDPVSTQTLRTRTSPWLRARRSGPELRKTESEKWSRASENRIPFSSKTPEHPGQIFFLILRDTTALA